MTETGEVTKEYAASVEDAGKRLDVFLSEKTGLTRSRVKRLCEDGNVKVCGAVSKVSRALRTGDVVWVIIPESKEIEAKPENIYIDIIYNDDDLAVINKPQGMTVHPACGNRDGTLVNALLYHLDKLSGINGEIRPGIVHRLDKNTSGLLVVAKNDASHLKLSSQIAQKECKRIYWAIVDGAMKQDDGVIRTHFGRSPKDRKKMAVLSVGGRIAVTHYRVIKRFRYHTLVEYELETGRTHQIRVHSKYLGFGIVGDDVYNEKMTKREGIKTNGQMLHARKLTFTHPMTGERMTFEAPLPDYFTQTLSLLEKKEKID